MVQPRVIKTRPSPYGIRLSIREKQLLESLRLKWQLGTKAKVLHKLISMADYLEDKYKEAKRKLVEETERFKWL